MDALTWVIAFFGGFVCSAAIHRFRLAFASERALESALIERRTMRKIQEQALEESRAEVEKLGR